MQSRLNLVAVLSSALIFISASTTHSEVRETRENKHYTVSGASPADVRASMNKVRPKGFDAYTSWNIRWNYTYRQANGRCAIASVTTRLAIAYTMPRVETQNANLQKGFDAYLQKLRVHEDGHANIGQSVARKIDDGIAGLTAPACETLDQRANALGEKLVKEGAAADIDYDRVTDHGKTQGARWP